MKALPIYIYKNRLGDCSNGGISSRYDELLLVHDEGYLNIDEDNMPDNLVKLVINNFGGRVYLHLEPVKKKERGSVGYMFGGCYAASSDGRFRSISKYPLPLHDRTESQKLYNTFD